MSNHIAIRIELCKSCDRLNTFNLCKECSCFMPAKVRLKKARCPLGKWEPVVDLAILPDAPIITRGFKDDSEIK
jgi:hypothetical protein